MIRFITRWQDRRLKKWCLRQAMKAHSNMPIQVATECYGWLTDQQPFDIQKALKKHQDTVNEIVNRGF